MRILVAINDLSVRGGTHKQVLRLCEYLNKNNDVVIYTRTYDKDKTYPEFQNFKIYSSNILPKYVFKNVFDKIKYYFVKYKLNKIEDRFVLNILKDVDIVNLHDSNIARLAKISKKMKKKVVLQINDMPACYMQGVNSQSKDNLFYLIKRKVYNNIIKNVDEITVNVTKNAMAVKKCMKRDARVLYCGVDINEKLEKHIKMHNDKKINLFSSGVFFPYRNYETLVKVVDKLVKNSIDVHLDIMGSIDMDKEYSNFIKNMINDLNLNEYIKVWGQVDEEKYVELHNNADIFLFININQSWGLAVFEAMSCGLPVIVSNSVGAIELLDNDENSIIVDPENVDEVYDKIIKLNNDATYYEKISENAYNIVKEFSWDNLYSSKMLEIFENIIKEK